MFDLILILLLIGFLLTLFSPTIRSWALLKLMEKLQRRMHEQMRQQYSNEQRQSTNARGERQAESKHRGKLDMEDIEAKRFERENSDDYVDFEELPK